MFKVKYKVKNRVTDGIESASLVRTKCPDNRSPPVFKDLNPQK